MQAEPSHPSNRKKYFIMAKICDKRGKVLSIGHNSYVRTHPLQAKMAQRVKLPKKEFLHAEMMALIRLLPQHRHKAHSITIYRFNADGTPALAKPCPVCESAIEACGIKHVWYTTEDNCLDMEYEQYEQCYVDEAF